MPITPQSEIMFSQEIEDMLKILTPYQTMFWQWSEHRFSSTLDRNVLANFTDATRQDIEEFWIRRLAESKRTWDDYRWYGDAQSYSAVDYERCEAISCLSALRSKVAVCQLKQIAVENVAKDARERWMAVRGLGMIGDKSIVPDLIHCVYHHNTNVRFYAQISLVRLTGSNYQYDWEKWGEWWNSHHGNPKSSFARIDWQFPKDAKPEDIQELTDLEWIKGEDTRWVEARLSMAMKIKWV